MEHRADFAAVDTEPTARVERSEMASARAAVRAALELVDPAHRVLVLAPILHDCALACVASAPDRPVAWRSDVGPGSHDLSDRQRQVLDFIAAYIERTSFPPTLREIGTALGIGSTNGVNDHLSRLERKGYIARAEGGISRGLRVLRRAG